MSLEPSPPDSPRVALVSGGLKLGGSTTFLVSLGGELVRRGIAAEVLSFEKENPLASDFNRLKVPVFWQDDRRVIFEDRVRAVCEELRRFKPTVVVACLGGISFEVLRYLPSGVYRAGLAQSHDPGVYSMLRRHAADVDLMAGVSRLVTETIQGLPEFAGARVCYLPYGVPMPRETTRVTLDAGAPLRLLYLGRLEEMQKRVRLFPRILDQLKASRIPFHWTIAGEGPERRYLESVLKSSTPDQSVRFTGPVLYEDVPALLTAHNVFLLASDFEGLPLSLLEAMGRGLVPVVSDLASGIRDVVDESNGRRIAPENVGGYAQAIVWLHEHREEMKRLSENSRARVVREYSVEAMTDRWLQAVPAGPRRPAEWPAAFRIKAPFGARRWPRFSLPGRILSRWLIRWRSGRG